MEINQHTKEKKWQNYWEENNIFKTNINSTKKKYYVLDMFPYPSGAGLHVGHIEGYTATDIIARYKRFQGYEVLHPIGWDAFGLPAEQYAIKTGNSPREFTQKNIDNFKTQLKRLGFSYDWDKEINTSDSRYYRNTQWIFAQLFRKGLAVLKDIEVNWSPSLNTVLANEEVLEDENGQMVSERDQQPVVKRKMKQWVLRITEYASRLFEGLEGLEWPESIKKLQRNWIYYQDNEGKYTQKLHLNDWIFARQRYWGEPFPIIHFENNEIYLIDEKEYPIELPIIENYKFTTDGLPALSKNKTWSEVTINGKKGIRDLNTMPQWAGSCWYYIAYLIKKPNNDYLYFGDSVDKKKIKKILDKWLPVDLYVGGQEHAVLHLMYARFWHFFLNDLSITKHKEPFQKLFNQGMILGEDNQKMSKSRGNVINPDNIIDKYGSDTLRIYEMFMGPLEDNKSWEEIKIYSIYRWLKKISQLQERLNFIDDESMVVKERFNLLLSKIDDYILLLKFNVAISEMMIFVKYISKYPRITKKTWQKFLIILSCFAPHLSEELNYNLFNNKQKYISISLNKWPQKFSIKSSKEVITVVLQVDGKFRGTLVINNKTSKLLTNNQSDLIELAKIINTKYVNKNEIKKIMLINKKIISIVTK